MSKVNNGIKHSSDNHYFFNTKSVTELSHKLSNKEKRIPSEEAPPEEWLRWADQLQALWLEALNLDKEYVILSFEELEALKNYLHAYELLITCKQSAVRVSRTAWESLEKGLLTWEKEESGEN